MHDLYPTLHKKCKVVCKTAGVDGKRLDTRPAYMAHIRSKFADAQGSNPIATKAVK